MEKIIINDLEVFIDYAHKPNALEVVLKALQDYRDINCKSKIWIVFGCGGNRDAQKRPIMGRIASSLADKIIVTDDNPRNELPDSIRQEIIEGIKGEYFDIGDRKAAIEFAIHNAEKNDIILIAGKGHEEYQIISGKVIKFRDAEVVKNMRNVKSNENK